MKRFVLEGEWSGYQKSQQRVVHRTVTTRPQKYEKLESIQFDDGTYLRLSMRPCKPREKVVEIHGYDKLIDKAIDQDCGFVTVASLHSKGEK